ALLAALLGGLLRGALGPALLAAALLRGLRALLALAAADLALGTSDHERITLEEVEVLRAVELDVVIGDLGLLALGHAGLLAGLAEDAALIDPVQGVLVALDVGLENVLCHVQTLREVVGSARTLIDRSDVVATAAR